ncbi:MAG: rhomboid family intramembrane serine protease [Calditrichaeota bacterium]|nr:MAG: rhomboid family intramembrane serine protease [Calditrichota bacterium]
MLNTISHAPVATAVFVLTLFISHYMLDRDHLRVERGLSWLNAEIQDTWLVLRYFFGVLLYLIALFFQGLKWIMALPVVRRSLPHILEEWMLQPDRVFRQRRYYLLITHGFIHANYIHLLVDMFVFYSFAFFWERLIGSVNFALIYFGSMILGALVSCLRKRNNPFYRSLGSSGALSGLIFSVILYFPNLPLELFFFIRMPGWLLGIIFLVGSYIAARRGFLPFIDHEGHIWGALSGILLTLILHPTISLS